MVHSFIVWMIYLFGENNPDHFFLLHFFFVVESTDPIGISLTCPVTYRTVFVSLSVQTQTWDDSIFEGA